MNSGPLKVTGIVIMIVGSLFGLIYGINLCSNNMSSLGIVSILGSLISSYILMAIFLGLSRAVENTEEILYSQKGIEDIKRRLEKIEKKHFADKKEQNNTSGGIQADCKEDINSNNSSSAGKEQNNDDNIGEHCKPKYYIIKKKSSTEDNICCPSCGEIQQKHNVMCPKCDARFVNYNTDSSYWCAECGLNGPFESTNCPQCSSTKRILRFNRL